MPGRASVSGPPSSLTMEPDVVEQYIQRERPSIEYFDMEEGCYREWALTLIPLRKGFFYPDALVYALEGERDHLRGENIALDGEVVILQQEVKRLLEMVKGLQNEASELRADRVRVGKRLRQVSENTRMLEAQLRNKDAHMSKGMKHMRESYESFEKAILESETFEPHGSESSVTRRAGVPAAEEEEGSNNEPNEAPGVVPVEDLRPYAGWCYG